MLTIILIFYFWIPQKGFQFIFGTLKCHALKKFMNLRALSRFIHENPAVSHHGNRAGRAVQPAEHLQYQRDSLRKDSFSCSVLRCWIYESGLNRSPLLKPSGSCHGVCGNKRCWAYLTVIFFITVCLLLVNLFLIDCCHIFQVPPRSERIMRIVISEIINNYNWYNYCSWKFDFIKQYNDSNLQCYKMHIQQNNAHTMDCT